jgi:hypothetical protein
MSDKQEHKELLQEHVSLISSFKLSGKQKAKMELAKARQAQEKIRAQKEKAEKKIRAQKEKAEKKICAQKKKAEKKKRAEEKIIERIKRAEEKNAEKEKLEKELKNRNLLELKKTYYSKHKQAYHECIFYKLSSSQRKVIHVIKSFTDEYEYGPSITELSRELGCAYKSAYSKMNILRVKERLLFINHQIILHINDDFLINWSLTKSPKIISLQKTKLLEENKSQEQTNKIRS